MAFGLLAREAQFTLAEALAMSGFVYSGSAQLVAVNAMRAGGVPGGAAMIAVAGTILLLNARYMLYGARSGLGFRAPPAGRSIRRSRCWATATGFCP